jgi:hypothetical protein
MSKYLENFTEWFVKNYPGPNTIICSPTWHAPKIFKAATYELERENAALKLDAERYRWLRDKSPGQYEQPIVVTQARAGDHMKYIGPLAYNDLDSAIDAAMGEVSKGD